MAIPQHFYSLQRTVHNIIENEEGQMLWVGAGLDILSEDQDGSEVSMQEGTTIVPTILPAAGTSSDTRTVHLSPGVVVKKEEQVKSHHGSCDTKHTSGV